MTRTRNRFVLIAIAAILFIGSEQAAANYVQKAVIASVNELNRSLPKMLTPNLRQETSQVTTNGIIHRYTALEESHDIVAQRWPRQDQVVTRANCSDPDIAEMLKRDVTITFLYYGNDGQLGGKVEVTAGKCGF